VGQIVGPEGNSPELHATTWEDIQSQDSSSVIIADLDVVPGIEQK
jgi:hypothetical protein